MTDTLRDKVAIVTGASRGIGAAIAERLASDGARVVVNYVRDSAAAESVVASICAAGNAAVAVQADISMPVEVERLTSAAMDRWGRLDIMVNNAGIGVFAPLEKVTEVDFQRLFAKTWEECCSERRAPSGGLGNPAVRSSISPPARPSPVRPDSPPTVPPRPQWRRSPGAMRPNSDRAVSP